MGQRTDAFRAPVFVVWRHVHGKDKGRVVVDLRSLNKVAIPDSYPLPLQAEVIGSLRGKKCITVIDATSFFFQIRHSPPLSRPFDNGQPQGPRTINSGTHGIPQLASLRAAIYGQNCSGLSKASAERSLTTSSSSQNDEKEHVRHLDSIFKLFSEKGISISPTKSFLGYPSVELHWDSASTLWAWQRLTRGWRPFARSPFPDS